MSTFVSASTLPDAIPPLWRIATKFAYFVGLAAAIGGVWTYLSVVRPAVRRSPDLREVDAGLLSRRALRIASVGTLVLVAVAYFQLAARVARAGKGMPYGEALAPSRVWAFLTKPAKHGEWIASGTLVLAANVCIVVAALVLLPAWSSRARGMRVSVIVAAVATMAVTLLGTVPTKAPEWSEVTDRLLTQAHIIGGSLWVGGLAAMAALAAVKRRLDESAAGAWALMWERFGVLALVSVGGVLISGLWMTYREVGAVGQFVSTTFGRFLLVKILLVVGLVAAGAYNQLVLMPRITRAQRAGHAAETFGYVLTHFPRVVLTEVALGIGVLAIVPFLNGSAREQAAGREVDGPTLDGGLMTLGLLLVATLAASFYATAKASGALGRRETSATREGVGASI